MKIFTPIALALALSGCSHAVPPAPPVERPAEVQWQVLDRTANRPSICVLNTGKPWGAFRQLGNVLVRENRTGIAIFIDGQDLIFMSGPLQKTTGSDKTTAKEYGPSPYPDSWGEKLVTRFTNKGDYMEFLMWNHHGRAYFVTCGI